MARMPATFAFATHSQRGPTLAWRHSQNTGAAGDPALAHTRRQRRLWRGGRRNVAANPTTTYAVNADIAMALPEPLPGRPRGAPATHTCVVWPACKWASHWPTRARNDGQTTLQRAQATATEAKNTNVDIFAGPSLDPQRDGALQTVEFETQPPGRRPTGGTQKQDEAVPSDCSSRPEPRRPNRGHADARGCPETRPTSAACGGSHN